MKSDDEAKQINWDGYEMYQNRGFAAPYCSIRNMELSEINGNLIYLTSYKRLGYTRLELIFPKKQDFGKTLDEVVTFCKEYKIPKLVIHTPNRIEFGKVSATIGTYVIDLATSIDDLWKGLKKETRNQVRQAEKKGVKVALADKDDFEDWWQIYENAVEKKGFSKTDRPLVEEVYRKARSAKLFKSLVEDKMIAGAFIMKGKGLFWWLGATDFEYLPYRPNHLLQWEIIKYGKENGFEFYDLGGIMLDNPKHGPSRFKAGWGGELRKWHQYEVEFSSSKTKFIKLGRKYMPKKVIKAMRERKSKRGKSK
jgi:lipid II:glycine glycyltransferase (peptidoglycan interpeptide bridge formation enzyme)